MAEIVAPLDSGTVALGVFIVGNIVSLVWGAATVRAQLATMQKELERQGRVLEALAEYKSELKMMTERSLMQGRRLDELTSLVMTQILGRPIVDAVNESTKG